MHVCVVVAVVVEGCQPQRSPGRLLRLAREILTLHTQCAPLFEINHWLVNLA